MVLNRRSLSRSSRCVRSKQKAPRTPAASLVCRAQELFPVARPSRDPWTQFLFFFPTRQPYFFLILSLDFNPSSISSTPEVVGFSARQSAALNLTSGVRSLKPNAHFANGRLSVGLFLLRMKRACRAVLFSLFISSRGRGRGGVFRLHEKICLLV